MSKSIVRVIARRLQLTAALPNKSSKPNRSNKDKNWIEKVERKQKGKPRSSGDELPEGLFETSPSNIASVLKSKSKDLKQAVSRLQYYINRAGDNLDSAAERRLEQAKEALYRSYGEEPPAKRK